MEYSLLLLLSTIYVHVALADRGTATNIAPTECNFEPTVTASVPEPTCYHAADPDGAQGLCPDLSNNGWCDCGSDGYYPMLPGLGLCDYESLDPQATIVLSTTNCVPTTTVSVTGAPVAKRMDLPPRRLAAGYRASRLKKRAEQVSYADSCNDPPPPKSSYNGNSEFPTMMSVLEQAYKDALTLANQAQNVLSDNKGFTHYFGGAKADVQLTNFQKMMANISNSKQNYAIQFECSNLPDCTDQSVFVTDATVGTATDVKVVQTCPKFWIAASTKYLLYDSNKISPTPPYRNNDKSGWCGKGTDGLSTRRHQYFATAGHSVLHELTHLDSLAQLAGLSADDDGRHGTLDAQTGCELDGARRFLADYKGDQTGDATSPDYNAESYAAAATEIYFMQLCGFTEIRPLAPAAPAPPAPAPTVSSSAPPTCNCDENGCTPESPPCCANGTCPPPTCDCNEDGCTPESPACCANGTC